MRFTEESEEQAIDRLLRELGIQLPEVDLTDEDPLQQMLPTGTETIPLPDEVSERLLPPLSF